MNTYEDDMRWQARFDPHYREIATNVWRVEAAGFEDDAKRNTDFRILNLVNGDRGMVRARRFDYAARYGDEFTLRLSRPSGIPTEFDKFRDGWGDFGIYGFESEPGSNRLRPWLLYNAHMLRDYLDRGGWWTEGENDDGTTFAAFKVADMPLGTVLNLEGVPVQPSMFELFENPDGDCRHCGRPSWQSDQRGPVHRCCALWESQGGQCPCVQSPRARRRHYGWPK